MERREFVGTAMSALFAYGCSCARPAMAALTRSGCRMAVVGPDNALGIATFETSGNKETDGMCLAYADKLIKGFGVQPRVIFYQDMNALSSPIATATGAPDGTVLLGLDLLNHEIQRMFRPEPAKHWQKYDSRILHFAEGGQDHLLQAAPIDSSQLPNPQQSTKPFEDGGFHWYKAILVIMAHEFGHIIQYKKGLRPDGPWQMEPHADFMAGWFLGRDDREHPMTLILDAARADQEPTTITPADALEAAVKTIFEKGDTDFNEVTHHGQPELRAAMVRAGYDAGDLNVDAAFAKGKKMASLG